MPLKSSVSPIFLFMALFLVNVFIIFFSSCRSLTCSTDNLTSSCMPSQSKNSVTEEIYNCLEVNDLSKLKEIFQEKPDLVATKAFWNTILFDIVRLGDEPELVKTVISKGADVNIKDHFLNTPLHIAALKGHYETAEFLILKGADVNSRANNNIKPLHYATLPSNEHKSIIKLLIENGADVNAKAYLGETALHNVASLGSKEVAELLIKHGANVNATKFSGFTPLHVAAINNNLEVAEVLILHKANVNAKDAKGLTPLKCIIKFHLSDSPKGKAMVNLLRNHGANE